MTELERSTLLSVVVPLFNEEENLPRIFAALQELAQRLDSVKLELVLVDDGSRDGTFRVANELAGAHENITAIKFARNYGSHAAIAAGMTFAKGDCALFIAGDMQDPPSLITEMLEAWRDGYKIVWAARTTVEGKSRTSEFFSTLYWDFFNASVNNPVVAGGVDFALVDRSVVEILRGQCHLPEPIFAQITDSGFAQKTIRYTKQMRAGGKSGWTLQKKFGLVFQTVFCSAKFFRTICIGAALMALVSLLVALTAAIMLLGQTSPITMAVALASIVLFHSLIIIHFGVLVFVVEYLSIRLRVPNSTPRFCIERVVPAGASNRTTKLGSELARGSV